MISVKSDPRMGRVVGWMRTADSDYEYPYSVYCIESCSSSGVTNPVMH